MDIISFAEAATANSRIEKIIAEPDSASGIVTTPSVIAAGEAITIPAGRTAVLPNVTVEGTLTVDGEVFVPSGSGYTATNAVFDTLQVQGQNVSPFSGFKNYIINGGFDVWQRGTSQTGSGYGSDDRWNNINIGSTKTHSQVVCTDTERNLFNANYFSRTVVSSVAGTGNHCYKAQAIEDVTKLAGKTVTLSFWAKADINKNIALSQAQVYGTGGSPSPTLTTFITKFSLTSTWQKFTHTLTLPTMVGKTLGTDGVHTSAQWFTFWFDAGSDFNSKTASLGQQSGTFDIAQVQLEEGSVATPFEQRPYGLELSLCQRYTKIVTAGAQASLTINCISIEPMRSAPTITLISYSGGTGATYASTFNANFIYQTTPHTINALSFLLLTSEL